MSTHKISRFSVLPHVLRHKFEMTGTGDVSFTNMPMHGKMRHLVVLNIIGSHSGPIEREPVVAIEPA
jgi:hypothetical protein